MRAIRNFNEFVKSNTVKKQGVDKSRANFLVSEAENSYNNLLKVKDKFELNNETANMFVKLCYDILMELIRAKMLLDGYNASGFGAHEAEVSYMRVLNFNEKDVQFLDQLRYFRNGMLYYGTILDNEYAEKVLNFLEIMYSKLRDLI